MDNQSEAACENIRYNPNAKRSTVARQFQVTRDRLRTRVEGGSGKRGPKLATAKLLAAEESPICLYIDRFDKINLTVRSEFITDAANYVLSQRSTSLEPDHTLFKTPQLQKGSSKNLYCCVHNRQNT